jgi:hypothetical protein
MRKNCSYYRKHNTLHNKTEPASSVAMTLLTTPPAFPLAFWGPAEAAALAMRFRNEICQKALFSTTLMIITGIYTL